jgi:acyl-CoA hydrolase
MFSDGVIDLIESGAVTGALKLAQPYQVVGSFTFGSKRLYDFLRDNPLFNMMRASYVNEGTVISAQPAMHAINSCIQIDLTGQICADSIGSKIFSGIGGQMDFMRGNPSLQKHSK